VRGVYAMTEWTTIRVRQDAKETADQMKPENVTWSEWIKQERDMRPIDEGKLADAVAARVHEVLQE